MNRKDIEILSPAGDLEKLKTAVAFGADAVYLAGKSFGLRTFSGNFTHEEMIEGIRYAHDRGVKCYVTMNIMAHEPDMDLVDDEIRFVAFEAKADAVIVSDAGIFRRVRRIAPELEIHISTQASVTNSEGCNFWYEQGAKRVVLAREVSLEETAGIRASIPDDMTIESFVHGAMCVSYSGRCLLSNYFTGRSSNKGSCAQPCRWGYYVDEQENLTPRNTIVEEKRLEDKLPIEEDAHGTYIFNSKDICMIDHIPELIAAGVNSFKIEGRIKGAYYVAAVTKAYREAVDMFFEQGMKDFKPDENWHIILDKIVHRDYATGFFFDRPGENAQIVTDRSYNKPAFVVGIVNSTDSSTGLIRVSQRNKVFKGDTVNALIPNGYVEPFTVAEMYDEDMNPIESAPHAQMTYYIKPDRDVTLPEMSFLSRDGDKDQGIKAMS